MTLYDLSLALYVLGIICLTFCVTYTVVNACMELKSNIGRNRKRRKELIEQNTEYLYRIEVLKKENDWLRNELNKAKIEQHRRHPGFIMAEMQANADHARRRSDKYQEKRDHDAEILRMASFQ